MLIFAWICWSALLLYGIVRGCMFVGYFLGHGDPDSYNTAPDFLKFRVINTILKTTIFIFSK